MSSTPCRLLRDSPAIGSWNMAVDEALLESAAQTGDTTLRFYRWSQPTLSLGYFQSAADRQQHRESISCDLVRRSTGGGAIVHDNELTYSLTTRHASTTGRRTEELYAHVHGALIAALDTFSVRAQLAHVAAKESLDEQPLLCFERRAVGDVLIGSNKIAGSAQRRRGQTVLQHGSVLLSRSSSAPQLAGIENLAARKIDPVELIDAWIPELSKRLDFTFHPAKLADSEHARAGEVQHERHLIEAWIHRR